MNNWIAWVVYEMEDGIYRVRFEFSTEWGFE